MENEVQGAIKYNINGTWVPITTLVGERGPTGGTVDVAIGTVEQTTGPTVTVTKSNNVAYFNFGLQKGDTGPAGSYILVNNAQAQQATNQSVLNVSVETSSQLVFAVPAYTHPYVSDWQVLVSVASGATCSIGRSALANFGNLPVYANSYDALDNITGSSIVLFSFSRIGNIYIMSRSTGFTQQNT